MSVLAPSSMSFSQLAVLSSEPINIDDSANLQVLIEACRAQMRSTSKKICSIFVSFLFLAAISSNMLSRNPSPRSVLFGLTVFFSSWATCSWMSYRLSKRILTLASATNSLQDLLVRGPFYQSLRPFAEIEPLSLEVIESRYRIFLDVYIDRPI